MCFFSLYLSEYCDYINRIRIDKLNQEYLVYFIGTANGLIYKIVQFIRYGRRFSNLLDILQVAENEPIQEMGISQRTGSLYLATNHEVKQIDLAMCVRRYDSCIRCVADPYCGWDKDLSVCKPYQLGLLQVHDCVNNLVAYFKYNFIDQLNCNLLEFFFSTLFTGCC